MTGIIPDCEPECPLRPENFPALPAERFQDAVSRWEEPHRGWHGKKHLETLLRDIDEDRVLTESDREMLRYVALFHDAIYDPLSATNEEDSARLAESCLTNYDRREEVMGIVLATKNHRSDEALARKFNTWDCAILGDTSWDNLLEYEDGIAFEYQVVPPEVYRRERSRFLRSAASEYDNPLLERLADVVTATPTDGLPPACAP